MFIFSLLPRKCRVLGRQRGKGERSQWKLAYKNVTNPGGARCESARHSVAKWLQPSRLERDPAPIRDAPETPLISSSESTTPTHTQWPHQCAAASTVVILFQGVIRDHVTKSRLWSQDAWAEIRAIPLTSSAIFGKLLTSLCLNSVISKWGRTGVSKGRKLGEPRQDFLFLSNCGKADDVVQFEMILTDAVSNNRTLSNMGRSQVVVPKCQFLEFCKSLLIFLVILLPQH